MTRTLNDLYVTMRPVTIDDGHGEPIEVMLVKPDPVDDEEVRRKASAARARIFARTKDKDSEEYLAMYDQIIDYSEDSDALIEFLVGEDLARKMEVIEAEVAGKDEWSNEEYLQGLRDLWADSLDQRHKEDPEDPEAKRVWEELSRFNDQVSARMEEFCDDQRSAYGQWPHEELEEAVLERIRRLEADLAWLNERSRWQIFFATRQIDNHKQRFFNSKEDVDRLYPETYRALHDQFRALVVEGTEGKDLPGTPASSPSSEPSEMEATEQPSGLQSVAP